MSMMHLTCSVGLGGINLPTDLEEVRFLLICTSSEIHVSANTVKMRAF
ncbi:hypothetical protein CLV76_104133 [Marivita geojedonensis]|nr:hypothetical protein CLV76_104133 [Marivita geojedonensis]